MRACAASAYLKSSAEQKGSLNVKERLPADRKRRSISVLGFGRVQRRPEIDALRGVFLVWMTLTHLPTHLSDLVNEPFGFVSSGEGFVFLPALLVARLYPAGGRGRGRSADKALEARTAHLRISPDPARVRLHYGRRLRRDGAAQPSRLLSRTSVSPLLSARFCIRAPQIERWKKRRYPSGPTPST